MAEKNGNELLDIAAESPTLDEVLARDPRNVSDDDLRAYIEIERGNRALFIKAQAEKKG